MTPSPKDPIRVLIVDDHHVVRLGLRSLLSHTGGFRVVGEAGSVSESVQMAAQLTPESEFSHFRAVAMALETLADPAAALRLVAAHAHPVEGEGALGMDAAAVEELRAKGVIQ